jgi:AcrR family transcriptional regulator
VATTNNSRFGEQAGTVKVLWGPRPQPTRGPKPALSIDRIAQAAIKVADADGLAAVTMQRIASELGFTKMALYRYVPGKAELIALMVDTAGDPPPVLDGETDDWRAQLGHWARRLLELLQRHPWLLEATVGPRIMGPNELGWLEQAVAALDGTGLHGSERMDAIVVILGQSAPSPSRHRPRRGHPRTTTNSSLGPSSPSCWPPTGTATRRSPQPWPPPPGTARRTTSWSSALTASSTASPCSSPNGPAPNATTRSNENRSRRCTGARPYDGGSQTRSWQIPCGSTMPPDGRDRPAGGGVAVLTVRGAPSLRRQPPIGSSPARQRAGDHRSVQCRHLSPAGPGVAVAIAALEQRPPAERLLNGRRGTGPRGRSAPLGVMTVQARRGTVTR